MKIEKLNENRIQITFNNSYLQENNIDIHTFMSNSIESQSLFLNMLDEAENKIGFITDNYKLSIEVLALSNGVFVITVTRLEKENLKSIHVHAKRKTIPQVSKKQLFKFNNFDDLCNFENFLSVLSTKYSSIQSILYKYDNYFYLLINTTNPSHISTISNIASEFGNTVENIGLVISKIKECGTELRKRG